MIISQVIQLVWNGVDVDLVEKTCRWKVPQTDGVVSRSTQQVVLVSAEGQTRHLQNRLKSLLEQILICTIYVEYNFKTQKYI